jgi:hypothetical protein
MKDEEGQVQEQGKKRRRASGEELFALLLFFFHPLSFIPHPCTLEVFK